MNTYPSEYLIHPVPVLAVYGLEPNAAAQTTAAADEPRSPIRPQTPRTTLSAAIATALASKSQYTLYEAVRHLGAASSMHPPFRVVFVDKNHVFPERLPPGPNLPPPHSSLSPLATESPLYPDGVMTPLWIQRHMETPSVVVGFYSLWHWSQEPGSLPPPKRETGPLSSQILIDPVEREKDTALAAEINSRRKYFQDKGRKFAAVIILKQSETEDPALDERLNLVRKYSGLDSKHSFFTIGPGTQQEIVEFVNILYRSLYEHALQFYSVRIKKARKKRSRLPSPGRASFGDVSSEPQPLSVQGWMFRYDFKTAFFQEMRQDIESAIKSYESAYSLLLDMLAPNSAITPGQTGLPLRGKRWEQAWDLVDCINIKICRFHLFLNDSTASLAQMNSHVQVLRTYCNAWGMTEKSFEHWAWLSKQYRIYGDVVDAAIQAGFKIPLTVAQGPGPFPSGNSMMGGGGYGYPPDSGCNPADVLQHPGFYYHFAAMCSAQQRRWFLEVDRGQAADPPTTAWEHLLAKERQVDHSAQTIELLTKSYEQFKKHRNSRMTLYLAAEIAGTYYESGKFEMALKFFERIGKTYRKENWHMVLTSILRWSLRCAKELGAWEQAIECLIELMAEDLPMADQKRIGIQKELLDILSSDKPVPEPRRLSINMNQINRFLECHVQFKTSTVYVDTPVQYQVTLVAGKTSPPSPLRLNDIRLIFSDAKHNILLTDNLVESSANDSKIQWVDCASDLSSVEQGEHEGWFTKSVDLGITKGMTKVLQGTIVSKQCQDLKLLGVHLDFKSSSWNLSLDYNFDHLPGNKSTSRRKWLEAQDPNQTQEKFSLLEGQGELNTVRITQKPPQVKMTMEYEPVAFVDELFKMKIKIMNAEEQPIKATVRIEMKNEDGLVKGDSISLSHEDNEKAAAREIEIDCIAFGHYYEHTLYLHGAEVAGTRLVSLTALYKPANQEETDNSVPAVEKREFVRIPFHLAFAASFRRCQQVDSLTQSCSPDLEKSEKCLITAAIQSWATVDLEIKNIEFQQEPPPFDYIQLALLSKPSTVSNEVWKKDHVHQEQFLFQLKTTDTTAMQPIVATGTICVTWRRSGQECHFSKTAIRLPPLEFQHQNLMVIANAPSDCYVGEPFTVTYTVYNPTIALAEYTASIELSDAFVFSGYKQLKGRVLPLSRQQYHYTCYPLLAGKVRLPRLKVIAKQQGVEKELMVEMHMSNEKEQLEQMMQRATPVDQPLPAQDWPLLVFVNARRYY